MDFVCLIFYSKSAIKPNKSAKFFHLISIEPTVFKVSVMFISSTNSLHTLAFTTVASSKHVLNPPGVCLVEMCVTVFVYLCVCVFKQAFLQVCVQHDVATPCPVQTWRWLCRQPHCQAWLASGTRCAWHPVEGEGRSTAGPGRLQHLSHRAKGPSGGALNTRTGPGRNDNEDQDCVTQDNT